ncbi:hypothetical protein N7468_007145 [Penicillium chermesinum]|uniref:O-methyltransferase n=1 Tax=Penicillium chermesinum TaxID=63820 RepID=A0A9W9TLW5_9EURO|nr:uncharacterized protein N7468_007145 [Penicillium chermesinum]KAJ5225920.1 hypothetical protein N7468_007145 [Penicillium chermesinum]KAJ6160873.1 hypothetical protein N7470_004269 [Penicillium chermesinum]
MPIENIQFKGDVEAHAETHLLHDQEALNHALHNSTKEGLPPISVSPLHGKFTSILVNLSGARNVLELGALGGYSAIQLARGLKGKGKVTSIEVDRHHRDVAIANLQHAGVKVPDEVEILLGAGLEVLPKLAAEIEEGKRERFDFVFIDADWPNQWNYFDWGVKLSNGPGSAIYIDNAVKNMFVEGVVGDHLKEDGLDVVAQIGADTRVEATVIQTVAAKSYDGIVLAVVK